MQCIISDAKVTRKILQLLRYRGLYICTSVSTAAQPLTVTGTLAVVPSFLTPISRKARYLNSFFLIYEPVKVQLTNESHDA